MMSTQSTLCLNCFIYVLVMMSKSTVQCIMGASHCYPGMWKVMPYFLDISLIFCHVHSRLCKKGNDCDIRANETRRMAHTK